MQSNRFKLRIMKKNEEMWRIGLGDKPLTKKQMEKEKEACISLILRCHGRSYTYLQIAYQLGS